MNCPDCQFCFNKGQIHLCDFHAPLISGLSWVGKNE